MVCSAARGHLFILINAMIWWDQLFERDEWNADRAACYACSWGG